MRLFTPKPGLGRSLSPVKKSQKKKKRLELTDAREYSRPEPFKYLTFPTPQEVSLKLDVSPVPSATDGNGVDGGCDAIRIGVERPVKGLVFDVEGEDARWSDQALDVVPGDDQVVRVWKLKGRKLKARYLGDGSA